LFSDEEISDEIEQLNLQASVEELPLSDAMMAVESLNHISAYLSESNRKIIAVDFSRFLDTVSKVNLVYDKAGSNSQITDADKQNLVDLITRNL